MGTLNLYNYDNNFELEAVPCAYGSSYQAAISIESHTFSVNDVAFTLTKSVSGSRTTLHITGNGYFADDGYFNWRSVMQAAGLGFITGEGVANYLNWLSTPGSVRYGGGDDSITYPMFRFKIEPFIGNRYLYDIYYGASSSNMMQIGLGETGTSNQRTFRIGAMLALDTKTEAEYGGFVFGLIGVKSLYNMPTSTGMTTIVITWDTSINPRTLNGEPWSPSSGEKGFRPIGDRPTKKTIGGGNSSGLTPKYRTDNITQPGAPDESAASAARLGFLQVYKITESNLNMLGQLLYNPFFRVALGSLRDPIDAVVSLNIFPCSPNVGSEVVIGALGFNMAAQALGITVHGMPIATQFKTFDFGTITIAEDWESFLDYDATSVTLFLPFIGEVDLPTDEVMGSSINVQYTIDFFTGMCVANVLIVKSVLLSSHRTVSHNTQHSYQGNCAINLPLSAVNYGAMIGSFVNAASSGLRTGIAGAVGSFASDVASGKVTPTITTKGTLSANAGYCGILYPYIIVTRPITTEPDNYQEILGYPSYMENSIGACEGLCVCEDIDLRGISGATDEEIEEIRQLCREGVRV